MKKNKDLKRKQRALELRQQGWSYNEINRDLGIAKSTLSLWLKDMPFSEIVKRDRLSRAKIQWASNIRSYNKQRHEQYLLDSEARIDGYARDIPMLEARDLFFLFMGLYWGEGSKKDLFCVRITNADPQIIVASMRFFRKHCQVDIKSVYGSVHIHPNINGYNAIEYWSKLTDIPVEHISVQTVVSRASKGVRPKNRLPYGTFHLIIRRASFRRQIIGWLRGVQQQFYKPE